MNSRYLFEGIRGNVASKFIYSRTRRSVEGTKYIEVVVIIDYLEFKYYEDKYPGDGMRYTQHRGLSIMNFVDTYYKTINTRVVITNLIVWNVKNLTPVTDSAHETLTGKWNGKYENGSPRTSWIHISVNTRSNKKEQLKCE